MKKSLLWAASLVITLVFAVFQRLTGPTYPLRGEVPLPEAGAAYRLVRSCETGADCLVLRTRADLTGDLFWRRYRTGSAWTRRPFVCRAGACGAAIPSQPPAGKVEYYIEPSALPASAKLPARPVVARFKGAVPAGILVPHVVLMFLFMLFSVRIFLSAAAGFPPVRHSVPATVLFLILGGFVFGPLTQYYAFGRAWTGFPFGADLTDNKTLLMLAFWLAALRASVSGKYTRFWLIAAFAVTAAVYFVPHSLFGSELDYGSGAVVTGK